MAQMMTYDKALEHLIDKTERIIELEAALRTLLNYVDRYQDQPNVSVASEIMRARKALAK